MRFMYAYGRWHSNKQLMVGLFNTVVSVCLCDWGCFDLKIGKPVGRGRWRVMASTWRQWPRANFKEKTPEKHRDTDEKKRKKRSNTDLERLSHICICLGEKI